MSGTDKIDKTPGQDPNEPDYSEGEQPILVIETPERPNGCPNCAQRDCEVRDNTDTSSCPSHSLKIT
ncbi:MAG: hypothetical protein KJZ90_01055 [Rhodocyclaceae bacterium]|nr:hypothetical protein [Rhodocyclaceae bacterium]